jgi:LPXTG-motif cell wall-anchored protein
MLLLGALALAVPAVTLAAGGGSAGDQQYTDPFGGTSSPTTSTAKTTSTTPATTSTAPATAAPTTTATPVASTPTASTPAGSDPTTPTATIASSTAGTLPRTGYDSWVAAALGFVLVGGGLALRVRARRA